MPRIKWRAAVAASLLNVNVAALSAVNRRSRCWSHFVTRLLRVATACAKIWHRNVNGMYNFT